MMLSLAVAGCQGSGLAPWGGGAKGQGQQQAQQTLPPPPAAVPPPPPQTQGPTAGTFAYGMPGVPTSADGLTRVAMLVPLSGPSAAVGQALLNAAEMALFDVGDETFVLQPYDTQGTPQGAQQAAARAIATGSQLMLGPVFSGSVQAVAPQARTGGVRMISYSTDPSVAGQGVYVIGYLLREQARRLVEHARAQGLQRFAALAPDNAYGRLMTEAYTEAAERSGGTVTRVVYYGPQDDLSARIQDLTDWQARQAELARQRSALQARGDAAAQEALARLQGRDAAGALPFDVLLLPETGQKLKEVASLLAFHDVDPSQAKLVGPMLWNDPALFREPALAGAWFPAPPPQSHESFVQRYRAAYDATPPPIASLGYDTVALAAVLARQHGPAAFGDRTLTDPTGFAGVDGLFRFLENGTSERGFAVMEIHPDGPVLVGQAPDSFAPQPGVGPGYVPSTPTGRPLPSS